MRAVFLHESLALPRGFGLRQPSGAFGVAPDTKAAANRHGPRRCGAGANSFRFANRTFIWAKARAGGFSLIEVVVAILILGIALVGLTEGITTALSSSKASELQTTAVLLAAGQIETLRAEGDFTDGETDGDFGNAFPIYRWKQTLSAAGIDGLHDVDVVVENSQTGQAIYELKTLLFEVPQGTNAVNLAAAGGPRFLAERRQP